MGGLAGEHGVGVAYSVTLDSACVGGAGQICAYRVEQTLYAFILERRAENHRHDVHLQGSGTQSLLDLVLGDGGGVVEVLGHEVVVILGDFLEHLVAPLLGFVLERCGDSLDAVVGTHGLVVPEDSLHAHQVDHAFEGLLGADGYLDGHGVCAEHILELAYHLKEVGTRAVHLVDVADTGHIVLVGLAPYGLRLGLYTAYGTESGHGAVEHTQRALHLYGEVDVSRGVNEVDFVLLVVVLPEGGGSGGSDGDTALLLLLHPVHGGGTVVHLAYLVGKAGVEKDALRRGGLAGVDMRHDTDVAGIFESFVCFRHCI